MMMMMMMGGGGELCKRWQIEMNINNVEWDVIGWGGGEWDVTWLALQSRGKHVTNVFRDSIIKM